MYEEMEQSLVNGELPKKYGVPVERKFETQEGKKVLRVHLAI